MRAKQFYYSGIGHFVSCLNRYHSKFIKKYTFCPIQLVKTISYPMILYFQCMHEHIGYNRRHAYQMISAVTTMPYQTSYLIVKFGRKGNISIKKSYFILMNWLSQRHQEHNHSIRSFVKRKNGTPLLKPCSQFDIFDDV